MEEEAISHALRELSEEIDQKEERTLLSFPDFLSFAREKPEIVFRDIFQVFFDMIKHYVKEGKDEYPGDPESINFVEYDCSSLLVDGADNPFFADRLFANRFIRHVEDLRRGAQQNKIYIIEGPHGCGKSTFLNNLIRRLEEYTRFPEGAMYEITWLVDEDFSSAGSRAKIEISCPSHDHPILIIPKPYRAKFLDILFKNDEIKHKISNEKEYEWMFKKEPCTICKSLFWRLFDKLGSLEKVLESVRVGSYEFDRSFGEGISVFNPGDKPIPKQLVLADKKLQERIDKSFGASNLVQHVFSRYARTNNGVYVLMDIKSHNIERLKELHNIISEGVHKVDHFEEKVDSLFIALMNPEDRESIKDIESFQDRITYITMPYVMEIPTEIKIYRDIFGKHIDFSFLPRVLDNFARIIISTRLDARPGALSKWIGDLKKYEKYCDKDGLLLKMEIYGGHIPRWLSEEDKRKFTVKHRKNVIVEGANEGKVGFSGRDSIKIFNDFFSAYGNKDHLITMDDLDEFFSKKIEEEFKGLIPEGFILSLENWYDYTVLQEVKEALFYFNKERISKDIQNYLFALNFEGEESKVKCVFTDEEVDITETFFKSIEKMLFGEEALEGEETKAFREQIQKAYASKTLTIEINMEDKLITETELFRELEELYTNNLKEKVLEPFMGNENFCMAIKDFGDELLFKTYDKKIRQDVTFMIKNLCEIFDYNEKSAKEMCIYVIENDIVSKF